MTQEAMRLALEALEDRASLMKWQKARDAVKEALAQPEQEPVACGTYQEVTDLMNALWAGTLEQIQIAEELKNKKLYTTPPQRTWQGLTDEDKKQMFKEANYHWEMTAGEYAERIGQLTEAKLKEKNGA